MSGALLSEPQRILRCTATKQLRENLNSEHTTNLLEPGYALDACKGGVLMSVQGLDYIGEPAAIQCVSCWAEMRVPDNALRNIVYLGDGDSPETFHPTGTGFLVDIDRPVISKCEYLVTAEE
jgi:hypothetical protein